MRGVPCNAAKKFPISRNFLETLALVGKWLILHDL